MLTNAQHNIHYIPFNINLPYNGVLYKHGIFSNLTIYTMYTVFSDEYDIAT